MIVLSAGMEKSGTGWYFNLTNDFLVAAGFQDIRLIREKYHLHSILKYYNCNVRQPTLFKLTFLLIPHFFGNTFVVKTHYSLSSRALHYLMSSKILKATYIYRDPRDVAISAYQHGQKIRARGQVRSFGQLDSIEASILYVKRLLEIWEEWRQCSDVLSNHVLLVKYEHLVEDTVSELKRLADFLEICMPSEALYKISKTYHVDSPFTNPRGLHFNKGVVGRFRDVMNQKELNLCQEHFGSYLRKMGYLE